MTALARPAPSDRIRGIDAARAVAIIGMVMVHFGPYEPDDGTLGGQVYALSGGRASVLFVLLAGVGISLLFAGRPAGQAWARIGWRALVFYPLGVALQALPTPVAVILQFYALYYVAGGLAAMLPTRALVPLTSAWLVVGPIAFTLDQGGELSGRGDAAGLTDPAGVLGDLLLTGYYPLITWGPALVVGVLVGRADLRATGTTLALTAAGAVTAAVAYTSSAVATAATAPGSIAAALVTAEGHTGAPLNVLGATGVAVAVLGLSLLGCRALPRATWPLVAVGQMALTVYVAHLIVLAGAPTLLEARDDVGAAAWKVARFTLVTAAICVGWRARFRRGPVEQLLSLPFRAQGPRRPVPGPGHDDDRHRQGADRAAGVGGSAGAHRDPRPQVTGDRLPAAAPAGRSGSGGMPPGGSPTSPPRRSPPATPTWPSPPGPPPPSS